MAERINPKMIKEVSFEFYNTYYSAISDILPYNTNILEDIGEIASKEEYITHTQKIFAVLQDYSELIYKDIIEADKVHTEVLGIANDLKIESISNEKETCEARMIQFNQMNKFMNPALSKNEIFLLKSLEHLFYSLFMYFSTLESTSNLKKRIDIHEYEKRLEKRTDKQFWLSFYLAVSSVVIGVGGIILGVISLCSNN